MSMSSTEKLTPQLCMKRDNLEWLPPVVLPEGYTLRTSNAGDGPSWALILNEAFGGERNEDSFRKEMVEHPAYRAERIFFICTLDGEPCATASAYRQQEWGASGYVHYVATRPSHAGKRLGYQVSLAVLHKFREDGLHDAVLQTDDFRVPAIKTYLHLGFHPLLVHANQEERWQTLFRMLAILPGTIPLEWAAERS